MSADTTRVLMGFYFYPRGGSAHASLAIAEALGDNSIDVTLMTGSRSDKPMGLGLAELFFSGCRVRPVDFTPALESPDPIGFAGTDGTAPMHASYEDRSGAEDPVFARLDDEQYELQVSAWARELERTGAPAADVLYLHHLTPINEAASRVAPGVPVVGHIHGSELLMLERIAAGAPPEWAHAEAWEARLREWAAGCERIVVNSPSGLRRSAELLGLDEDRFAHIPNGFKADFSRKPSDRSATWLRHLVEAPLGWAPGADPGTVSYEETELDALTGTTLLSVGRFTEVKRLPLLIEAFAAAQPRFRDRTSLVLLGGFPGEWEGEHPLETIRRTGAENVFLAGWHDHAALPAFLNSCDVLVHPSVMEQFGQVVVEAMACGLPVIAVDRGGPADILEDGVSGWLIPPDDRAALERAMVVAVNDPVARRRIGGNAHAEAAERYAWGKIGARIADLVQEAKLSPGSIPAAASPSLAAGPH